MVAVRDGLNGAGRALRLQLWSCYYDPEPMGIGPVSAIWARGLRDRGHHVEVVAAHPHYPNAAWGKRVLPYREELDGIPVLRLPLWIGRRSATQRIRQELSLAAAHAAALPALARPDVLVSVSPSFPALLPGMVNARLRRLPWVLWLHDLLPDGASATGLLEEGALLEASKWLERTAYRRADRVVILSEVLRDKLLARGVAPEKLDLIYNPASHDVPPAPIERASVTPPRVLSIGNIGRSQALDCVVREFQRSPATRETSARLIITGDGVRTDAVRAEIRDERVELLGVVSRERLEQELRSATLALVSQRIDGVEFNLPSKLMNFMAYGIPVIAVVSPRSEVARLVERSGCGWVVDSASIASFPERAAAALADRDELARRGRAGWEYARGNFTHAHFLDRFEEVLLRTAVDPAGPDGDGPPSRAAAEVLAARPDPN